MVNPKVSVGLFPEHDLLDKHVTAWDDGAMSAELGGLSATEVAGKIRLGEISSEELVQACLYRIEERESAVHAWKVLDLELVLAQARRCDTSEARSPLHGVPIGIKDQFDTAGMPTGYGSPIYEGHQPVADAESVARLRAAGAVVLGKTKLTEFALYHPTDTTNPLDPARTPGGSSSGSAAAVADHMVPVATGTWTVGSIIRPASYCGIFGYKPTFGSISRAGVLPLRLTRHRRPLRAHGRRSRAVRKSYHRHAPTPPVDSHGAAGRLRPPPPGQT
jgi:Asp-tRNA(Asn)/Glu-tRNA(Gln) amidotransferase A subunit family amidase